MKHLDAGKETREGNRLIAEFMGYKWEVIGKDLFISSDNGKSWHGKLFDKDWNSLMSVVEKIDSLRIDGSIVCQTNATSHTFYINYNDGKCTHEGYPKYYNGRHRAENETRINNVWQAVVQFIQWSSENKK